MVPISHKRDIFLNMEENGTSYHFLIRNHSFIFWFSISYFTRWNHTTLFFSTIKTKNLIFTAELLFLTPNNFVPDWKLNRTQAEMQKRIALGNKIGGYISMIDKHTVLLFNDTCKKDWGVPKKQITSDIPCYCGWFN